MTFSVEFENRSETLSSIVTADEYLKTKGVEQPLAVKINGVLQPLSAPLNRNCRLETVAPPSAEAAAVLRHTLSFLTAAVFKRLFPKSKAVIQRSVPLGYAYTVDGEWSRAMAECLYRRLDEARRSGEPISEKIDFEVIFEEGGCAVRFCADPETGRPLPYQVGSTLARVYGLGKRWCAVSGVSTVGDLNECVRRNRVGDFIRINETLQENALAAAAAQIRERGEIKAVLLAGPSSSGKTTTLKRLCTQLEVLGYHTVPLSLDNYYKNREEIPKDENGQYDFECLESIDVDLIRRHLTDFFDGKTIVPPVFDFVLGKSRPGKPIEPRSDSLVVIEGIHGLNPQLLPETAADRVFKVYLSALTQIRIDDANRISTTDNRLLRRLVRDAKYRGTSAERTFSMWPKVVAGERQYIFPYQNEADVAFNSSLDYEISVLKVYAEPLLRSIQPDSPYFDAAGRLLKLLSLFLSIPAQDVPPFSLLREFIGNSGFSY